MNMLKEIIQALKEKIKTIIDYDFDTDITVNIFENENEKILITISDNEKFFDDLNKSTITNIINNSSGLIWEIENDEIILKDGFIICEEEYGDDIFKVIYSVYNNKMLLHAVCKNNLIDDYDFDSDFSSCEINFVKTEDELGLEENPYYYVDKDNYIEINMNG